jgi:hypothetical protein
MYSNKRGVSKTLIFGVLGGLFAILIIGGLLLIPRVIDSEYIDEFSAQCAELSSDTTYELLALTNNDDSYCNSISDDISIRYCKAQVSKNEAICDHEDVDTNECFAIIRGDSSLCPEENDWCEAIANRDPSICDTYGETEVYTEQCKLIASLDFEGYQKFEQSRCQDEARSAAAAFENNPKICEGIKNKETKQFCLDQF